jgi:AcrR family transcriptional regulator
MNRRSNKASERTQARILATALDLYNRFGEPNVSTSSIASALGISPGNLHYHFATKDSITEALFEQHAQQLRPLLAAAPEVADADTAWFFLHSWCEHLWQSRFWYRNQNDLIGKSRTLEVAVKSLMDEQVAALHSMLGRMVHSGAIRLRSAEQGSHLATSMVVMINYWLSFEYVLNPRQALEPSYQQRAVLNSAVHVLGLLAPYLDAAGQSHFEQLLLQYQAA